MTANYIVWTSRSQKVIVGTNENQYTNKKYFTIYRNTHEQNIFGGINAADLFLTTNEHELAYTKHTFILLEKHTFILLEKRTRLTFI